jgi:hypothetical protein
MTPTHPGIKTYGVGAEVLERACRINDPLVLLTAVDMVEKLARLGGEMRLLTIADGSMTYTAAFGLHGWDLKCYHPVNALEAVPELLGGNLSTAAMLSLLRQALYLPRG